MNKQINNMIVPILRFPEFRNAGEWKIEKIGSLCKSFSGGTPSTTQKEFYGGNIPFIRSAEIDKESTELFLTKEGLNNSSAKLINKGDILFALYGANSGEIAISKQDGAINQAVLCLRSESSNAFFYQFLLFKKNWIINKYIQGGQGNLSGEIVKSIYILFPNHDEQHKIAYCLSSQDELITAQTQKLDALKAHKKGLMQQLFPAEGETVPKLRFAEFRDKGEWEEKRLKQICELNPSVENLPKSFVYIDLESVESGVLLRKRIITLDSAPSRAKRLLKNGDIIFQMVRPYQKNNYFFQLLDELDYVASTGYAQLRAHQSSMYLFQYLHHQCFVDKVLAKCTGSNYPAINSSELSEILVVMPDILEQQKIASCLSSLDELITTQSQKLEALKAHKKGLMQQLFPKVEEETHA